MSHFVRSKSQIKNKELLKKAFQHMKLPFEEGNFVVDLYGTQENVQFLLSRDRNNSSVGALGFKLEKDGTYSLVGDPYHCASPQLSKYYRKQDQLTHDLTTAYTFVETKDKLADQGFELTENEQAVVGPDGKIRLTFTQMFA